jgi:CBS domain containing-hemolysin-like protein
MTAWFGPQILGLAGLFLLGAFLSAIETALISMSRHRLAAIAEQRRSFSKAIRSWLDNPNKLLTTMLIGINLVAVGSSALATTIMIELAELLHWPMEAAVGASTFVVAVIIIMFGEIIPKIVAIHNPERVTLLLLRPLWWLDRIFYPVTGTLVWISNSIIHLFGGRPEGSGPGLTAAEIWAMLKTGQEQGLIDRSETEMIHGIFELGDKTAREIMVPRIDMASVEESLPLSQVIRLMEKAGHSRVPVYRETIDNITGIAYATDINRTLRRGAKKTTVGEIVRQAHFVPESKRLDGLLREFQAWKTHLAVVVDEYGGTAGMVTLEDILEEIVGDIRDEFDTEEPLYRRLDERSYRIDCRINIDEINEALGTAFPTEGYETFGGFIYDLAGKVPSSGEKMRWPTQEPQWEFTVESVRKRRIMAVRARRLAKPSVKAKESPALE